ncbi:hypothetical protein [Limnoglobus roseus]|uniref:Uncharacterized protein n=1 Tax=Limnoglobus roseus TaxID=2598579 RepID=A0A5C1AH98_9BACT|nr:hypothetical protein [Limnoglobus roseus]QEL17537.1 hypothetical protein PX52LOC_04527 [Limnoglobus roseus]
MSDASKTVRLRFDWDAGGTAAKGVKDLADSTKKAADETKELKKATEALARPSGITPTGGGPGNLFGAASTRDQLILEAMRHKNYEKSGLTPADLTRMTDQQLVGLKASLTKPPTAPAPATLLGKFGAGLRSGAANVAQSAGLGGLEKLGTVGAIVAAGVSALPSFVESFHEADLADYMGAARGQKARAFANNTILGRTAVGFLDGIRGREQDFRRVEYDQKFAALRQETEDEKRAASLEVRRQRIGAESRAAVLSGDRRMAFMPAADRMTVAGERAFREAQQLLPARQDVIDREKDLSTAEDMKSRQGRLLDELERRTKSLTAERADLMQKAEAAGGAEQSKYAGLAIMKGDQITKAQEDMKSLRVEINQAEQRIVQAKAEVGRSRIGVMQGELGILGQRVEAATDSATRIGLMNDFEYTNNLRFARLVKSRGLSGLSPDVIAGAAQIDPALVQNAGKVRGVDRIRSGGLAKEFPGIPDELPTVQGQYNDLLKKLTLSIEEVNRKQAADAVQKVSNDAFIKELEKFADRRGTRGTRS